MLNKGQSCWTKVRKKHSKRWCFVTFFVVLFVSLQVGVLSQKVMLFGGLWHGKIWERVLAHGCCLGKLPRINHFVPRRRGSYQNRPFVSEIDRSHQIYNICCSSSYLPCSVQIHLWGTIELLLLKVNFPSSDIKRCPEAFDSASICYIFLFFCQIAHMSH